jgi:hypothetical protein
MLVRGGGSKLLLSRFDISSYIIAEPVLELSISFGASFSVLLKQVGDVKCRQQRPLQ